MEENTTGIIHGGDMSKMPGFKSVCMKLGAMIIIIFCPGELKPYYYQQR